VSRRALVVAATALAVTAVVVAVVLAGGGEEDPPGTLGWVEEPLVFTPKNLPRDRTVAGEVSNDTLKKLRLRARRIVVVDAGGRRQETVARFLRAYSHGLYPPTQRPAGYDQSTQARLEGQYVDLKPGERAPLTVSWRLRPGARAPFRLDYGGGTLPVGTPSAE